MIAATGLAALWMAAALALVMLVTRGRAVAAPQAVLAIVAVGMAIGSVPGWPLAAALALLALALFAMLRRSRWTRRAPTANVALILAGAGTALVAVGAICDAALPTKTAAIAKVGQRLEVGPWLVEYATVYPVAGPDFTAIEAELRATRGSGVSLLRPQWRTMIAAAPDVSPTVVATFWTGQLSARLEAPDARQQLHLRWRPLLALVWLGEAMIVLGGIIALAGIAVRRWTRRPPPRGRYDG